MTSDCDDLRDYAVGGDEAAFRRIVERHAGMVQAVAMRMMGDRPLAEEITQRVFCILARKALFLGQQSIAGWLHTAAAAECRNARRKEARRQRLLRAYSDTMNDPNQSSGPEEQIWADISPHLDEAMGRLSAEDREMMVLRYFERSSFREISKATGRSEEACRQRARRALGRLAESLTRRGVLVPGAALGTVLAAQILSTPPASAAVLATIALQSVPVPSAAAAFLKPLIYMTTQNLIKISAITVLVTAIPAVILLRPEPLPRMAATADTVVAPAAGSSRPGSSSTANGSGKVARETGAPAAIDWKAVARKLDESSGITGMLAAKKLRSNLEKLSTEELASGLEELTNSDIPEGTRQTLRHMLVEVLAPRDPMAVLNRFPGDMEKGMAVELSPGLAELAKRDLAAADAWLKQQQEAGGFEKRSPNGDLRDLQYFQGALLGTLRESDPAAFGRRMLALPADQRGDAVRWASGSNFKEAAAAATKSGDPAVMAALLDSDYATFTATLNHTEERSNDAIFALLAQIPDEDERTRIKAKLEEAAAKTFKVDRF